MRNFRKWVTDDNRAKAKLFLTWSGKSFAYSSDISSASNSLWQKAKMKGHGGANKFRKAAVSALRDCKQTAHEEDSDLANLMGHSKATADRNYYIEQKIDSVKRAGKLLPKIMLGQTVLQLPTAQPTLSQQIVALHRSNVDLLNCCNSYFCHQRLKN